MKKVFTLSLIVLALVFSTTVNAQEFSGLDKSPMDMASFPSSYKVSDKAVNRLWQTPVKGSFYGGSGTCWQSMAYRG